MNVTANVTGKGHKAAGRNNGTALAKKLSVSGDGSLAMSSFIDLVAPRNIPARQKDVPAGEAARPLGKSARAGNPIRAEKANPDRIITGGIMRDSQTAKAAGSLLESVDRIVEGISGRILEAGSPAEFLAELLSGENNNSTTARAQTGFQPGKTANAGTERNPAENRMFSRDVNANITPPHRGEVPAEKVRPEERMPLTTPAEEKPASAGSPENTLRVREVKERNSAAIAVEAAFADSIRTRGTEGSSCMPGSRMEQAMGDSGKSAGKERKAHVLTIKAGDTGDSIRESRLWPGGAGGTKTGNDGTNRPPENRDADHGGPGISIRAEKFRPGAAAEILHAEQGRDVSGTVMNAGHVSGGPAPVHKLNIEQKINVVENAERGVVEQIAQAVSRTGKDEIKIRLFPPELGEMKISVSIKDRKVKASFIVESAAVKNAVDSGTGRLAQAISQEGFTLENLDVSVNDSEKHAGWNGPDEETVAGTAHRKDAVAAGRHWTGTRSADGIDLLA